MHFDTQMEEGGTLGIYRWGVVLGTLPVNRLPASVNKATEPEGILLMLPIHDTRIWYHDLIA